jgi:hypothetical protein
VTRTLVLAERPFRDLRSQAILGTLPVRLGAGLLVPTAAASVPAGFVAVPADADPAALGVARMVLAGVFQDRAELQRALAIAARGVAAGATLEARGLTLAVSAARREPPVGAEVLDAALLAEARDPLTLDILTLWRVAAPLALLAYPERDGAADATLAATLPEGPVLGLALLGGPEAAWLRGATLPALRARLAPFAGWPVLPLAAEFPGSTFDEAPASLAFAAALAPDARLLLPEMAEPAWRRRNMTPARLRGLVARCAVLVGGQDITAAMAVATGVPVVGVAPRAGHERRIATCLGALANALPPGSALVYPPPGA